MPWLASSYAGPQRKHAGLARTSACIRWLDGVRATFQARLARAEEAGRFRLASRAPLLVCGCKSRRRPALRAGARSRPLGLSNTGDKLRSSEVHQASSASSPCSTAPRAYHFPLRTSFGTSRGGYPICRSRMATVFRMCFWYSDPGSLHESNSKSWAAAKTRT